MRMRDLLLIACVLLVVAPSRASAQANVAPASHAHEIAMTAKKYEFNPNVITVKKGEQVKLVITALDREHGFKLGAFGIDQKLKKGKAATIEFVADKAGTFPFECSKFCGFGHGRMKGKLVVEE
jgi:cytochrome c oxidase subunit 2